MGKNEIIKPSTLQLVIGLLCSISKKLFCNKMLIVPEKIKNYKLISKIDKKHFVNRYATGVYKYGNKKYFIKTWTGRIKDFEYYDLINEYIATKSLHSILKPQIDSRYKICTPKVIDIINSKNSLSVVFEYIEAKPLAFSSKKDQIDIMVEILKSLNKASLALSNSPVLNFSKHGILYYLLNLPFFTFLTTVSNIKSTGYFIKALVIFLRSFKNTKTNPLVLAHRDLNLNHILVKNSKVYLVDCSRVLFTLPGYDLEHISINPAFIKIYKFIYKRLNYLGNPFLSSHILIHHACSFGYPDGYKNFYLTELKKRYEK